MFYSIVLPEVKAIIEQSKAHFYDVLNALVAPLSEDLQMAPQPQLQRSHSIAKDADSYQDRIAAIEYTWPMTTASLSITSTKPTSFYWVSPVVVKHRPASILQCNLGSGSQLPLYRRRYEQTALTEGH